MIQLQLTAEEGQVLFEVLESYVSDVRMEIADTDSAEFKVGLRRKKDILKKILDTLRKTTG